MTKADVIKFRIGNRVSFLTYALICRTDPLNFQSYQTVSTCQFCRQLRLVLIFMNFIDVFHQSTKCDFYSVWVLISHIYFTFLVNLSKVPEN